MIRTATLLSTMALASTAWGADLPLIPESGMLVRCMALNTSHPFGYTMLNVEVVPQTMTPSLSNLLVTVRGQVSDFLEVNSRGQVTQLGEELETVTFQRGVLTLHGRLQREHLTAPFPGVLVVRMGDSPTTPEIREELKCYSYDETPVPPPAG